MPAQRTRSHAQTYIAANRFHSAHLFIEINEQVHISYITSVRIMLEAGVKTLYLSFIAFECPHLLVADIAVKAVFPHHPFRSDILFVLES